MFSEDLRRAGVCMLKGGVAPKYVRRTLAELETHYADTRDALVAQGLSCAEAERQAAARIGDLGGVVREALERRELKSFVSLHPRTALLLGPALTYVVVAFVFIGVVAGLLAVFPIPEGAAPPAALIALIRAMGVFYQYFLPLLLSTALLALAGSRGMPAGLMVAGVVLIAVVGSVFNVTVREPSAPGEQGSIVGTLSLLGYVPGFDAFSIRSLGHDVVRIALTLLFSCAAWWWLGPRPDRTLAS